MAAAQASSAFAPSRLPLVRKQELRLYVFHISQLLLSKQEFGMLRHDSNKPQGTEEKIDNSRFILQTLILSIQIYFFSHGKYRT